jgi:hypothetical protein
MRFQQRSAGHTVPPQNPNAVESRGRANEVRRTARKIGPTLGATMLVDLAITARRQRSKC